MKTKFDQYCEGFLSTLGKGISKTAGAVQKAYNLPGQVVGAAKSAVIGGDISPITGKLQELGNKMQGKKPQDSSQDGGGYKVEPFKANDKVRITGKTITQDPRGIEGKLSQPEKYQGGNLYTVNVANHPKIGSVKIYDNPNSPQGKFRETFYFDKAGQPIQDTKLFRTMYAGLNPNATAGQKEWIVSDDESALLPRNTAKR